MAEPDRVKLAKLKQICENPVLWAKAFLKTVDNTTKKIGPWNARWYQAEMLLDPSDKKVARCGRRCLPGWDKIFDPDTGELKTVDDLFAEGHATVATMDSNYKMKSQSDCPVAYNGEKEVFRVTLKSGKVIDATGNHPLFTAGGWKEISQLKKGDFVATPSKLDFFGNEEIDDNDVKLLAYMIGDGNCKNHNLRFAQIPDTKQCIEMNEVVHHYGCELHHYDYGKDDECNFIIRKIEHRNNRMYPNMVKETLVKYGVYDHGVDDKTIPKEIFKTSKRQVSLFLSRLYSTDGWAFTPLSEGQRGGQIGYCSNSEELIRGIGHLLLRYGIRSTIHKKKKAWLIDIMDRHSVNIFAKEIGIYGKEKAVQKYVDFVNKRVDHGTFMPFEINFDIQDEMFEQHVSKADIVRLWEDSPRQNDRLRLNQYKLHKPKAKLIADYLHMGELSKLIDGEIEWEAIKSIESLGVHKTYDFTVPNTHNFVANDVITHNTGKTETMVVQALWEANTHRSFVSLFAAPYEAQIRMIFNRITELINLSPAIKDQVVSNTKTPFEIKFKNGSAIRGFTTGASSGGGAQSLRGQRSDSIYIDESDYLADADFDSILAIAGEREGIKVFLSSTPTGARKRFWQCCTDPKMHFKQFHYPSTCNPQWGPKMEEEFRAQLSEQGYVHEILADFGTQETGVFDKDKLDAAMRVDMYAYDELTYSQKMRVEQEHIDVEMMIPPKGQNLGVYRPNPFRTMGINFIPRLLKRTPQLG